MLDQAFTLDLHAAGQSLEELDEPAADELAQGILRWAARGIYIILHSKCPRNVFTKIIQWWESEAHVEQVFRDALPDTYKKVLGFLEVQFGTCSFVYDRCPWTWTMMSLDLVYVWL